MLTLVCVAFVPVMVITLKVMISIFTDNYADAEQRSFEEAGKERVIEWRYPNTRFLP